MTTTIDRMKIVLKECGQFTEQEIAQLFDDAHTGRHLRYDREEDEEQEQDTTIDRELVLFMAQREAYDRATDDGRCLRCEGWGCETCDHTGGY